MQNGGGKPSIRIQRYVSNKKLNSVWLKRTRSVTNEKRENHFLLDSKKKWICDK